jgi:hypothetical protein
LPSDSAEVRELSQFVNRHFATTERKNYIRLFKNNALYCNELQLVVNMNVFPPWHKREPEAVFNANVSVWPSRYGDGGANPTWTIVPDRTDPHAFVFVRTPPTPVSRTCFEKTFFHVRTSGDEFAVRHIPDFDHIIEGNAVLWEQLPLGRIQQTCNLLALGRTE